MTEPLLDPDCRAGKCGSCVGGPCQHWCHTHGQAAPEPPAPSFRDRLADNLLAATYPPDEWPDGPPGEGEMDTARDEADAVLAALGVIANGPSDLPAKMAEAMRVARDQWVSPEGETNHHEVGEHFAVAALAVHDEHTAYLVARLAQAEARAEHAEGELSSRRDHHDRWELEKARADAAEKLLDASGQDVERLEAERDALNAAIARVRAVIATKTWPSAMVRAEAIRAAVDGGE